MMLTANSNRFFFFFLNESLYKAGQLALSGLTLKGHEPNLVSASSGAKSIQVLARYCGLDGLCEVSISLMCSAQYGKAALSG